MQTIKTVGTLALVATLLASCGGAPVAILTAPIIAPIMTIEAWRNRGKGPPQALIEAARSNTAPLPPVDEESRRRARVAVEQALAWEGTGEGGHWENEHDASGQAAGWATVVPDQRGPGAAHCRELLIATVLAGRPTHYQVKNYCSVGGEWKSVATVPGTPAPPQ